MPLSVWEKNRPGTEEYDDFYQGYISHITGPNVLQTLIEQGQQTYTLIQKLSPKKADFRYSDEKWSIKEVIGHLIDTERIMGYRTLCISRGESAHLPGYDQNRYVKEANFGNRSLQSLSTEYDALRNANICLFNSFSPEQINQTGTANNATVSVLALAYIIAGHEKHHLEILEEKYRVDIR